jgi:hypothetical protein
LLTPGKVGPIQPAARTGKGVICEQFAEPRRAVPGKPIADRRVNLYIDGYNFYVPLSSSGRERDYELAWCNFLRLGEQLVQTLAQENQQFAGCKLGAVKYFTATIPEGMPSNASGVQRKHNWLDALNHETGGKVEVIHGTFRARKHRFYIERDQLDQLARSGIPINWDLTRDEQATYHPQLTVHEEKQTDVMLACSLVTDAALGRAGAPFRQLVQSAPLQRANTRPTPPPCHAAIVISADIDFLPAAEMAAQVFGCPVVTAFAYPHSGYKLTELATRRQGLSVRSISADELRKCMLPSQVVLGDGRRVGLDEFRKSHFQKAQRFQASSQTADRRRAG